MISRICARLILIVGIAGLAQVRAGAQATLDAAQSQFGTGPAPYATPAIPVTERAQPLNQPLPPNGAYAAPGYAPQQETGALGAPDPSKPLGRGDVVTFAIAEDREPPTVMQVTDTGELDFSAFPKIGRVSVVGRTCAQVATELKHRLEADYYYHADVTLGINRVNLASSRGKIYLSGNIAMPGPQDLPATEHTTVSGAIIRAGGFAKFADGKNVKITRKDPAGKVTTIKVDVDSIITKGHRERDVELQDGDYINVPQRWINF